MSRSLTLAVVTLFVLLGLAVSQQTLEKVPTVDFTREDILSADLGVAPMPGPGETRSALVGGASLYIVADKGDARTAAAWDYISHLVSAESQATWAAATGYAPVREDALELEPLSPTGHAELAQRHP